MRVQFSPCGVGLGHVGRCIPIAKKLGEVGAQVLFSTYREGLRYVQQEGFPVAEAPSIGFAVKPDGTVDFRQTTVNPGPFISSFTFLRQIDAEIKIMKAFNPDVVVSDSRVSPLVAAKLLGIPELCIINQFQVIIPRRKRFLRLARLADAFSLTVIGKIWTTGSQTLIPDFPPPYTLSTENLRIPIAYRRRVKLIGPMLPVRPYDLPGRKEIRKKLSLEPDKPLIFAPISGPLKERAYFTDILGQIFKVFPDDYEVIMSLGDPDASAKPTKDGNVTIYGWIPNRFEILKTCDLVIARAGHGTVAQSICYGKPLILVPTPSHTEQLNNARNAAALGVCEMIEQGDLDKDFLLTTVRRVLGDDRFQKRVKRIQDDVTKLNGLETAVRMVIDAAEG